MKESIRIAVLPNKATYRKESSDPQDIEDRIVPVQSAKMIMVKMMEKNEWILVDEEITGSDNDGFIQIFLFIRDKK
ncbi:MAG: hypothetical protein A3F47_00675 [Candidatus Staskawiczbacteria bacterium RIFCSPHIGHO2_12_FULL_38_11]|uniref:Uncharacterized protein n=1 Tax=Candidatus Staskawiczbacteria bacterium RIFCSPHIGHO2_12_FULL_38_11 TaxID=1802209 RepID=A0A1G2I606_9BACT|nr:MAG: hypothetical protein A3F47_00675 [Candidatus Staskawiczbacteria bacterium RIFCSPHIGHO2_12_FULL_38_11]